MRSRYKVLLFDLDGTLSSSAYGIRISVEAALKKMNKPIPDLSDYSQYIGPPLITTFQRLCGLSEREAEQAALYYRDDYENRGKYKNYMFEGIDKLLKRLKDSGVIMAVASSKFEGFASWVVDYIGLGGIFDAICGSTLDGKRKEKADIIRYAAEILNVPLSSESVCLVGDTKFDALGAVQAGCDFVGVGYGYGTIEQMESAGGKKFAGNVAELYGLLFE